MAKWESASNKRRTAFQAIEMGRAGLETLPLGGSSAARVG